MTITSASSDRLLISRTPLPPERTARSQPRAQAFLEGLDQADRTGGAAPPASDHRTAAGQHRQHRARQLRRCLGARLRLLDPVRLGTGPGLPAPGRSTRRGHELQQRVLQLMRGLLNVDDAPVGKGGALQDQPRPARRHPRQVRYQQRRAGGADDGWGHLQLDATALFLLQLAQLTRSGLVIMQTSHERDFIQNLVYYVARAYRVADYGIWERGDKGNHGLPERNASSIGLVKAALEALGGSRSLRPPRRRQLLPHHSPRRDRAPAAGAARPAAAGIRQQGGRQRLPVGDRLPRLGGGGSRPGGTHPPPDPPTSWAAPTATSASAATAIRRWWRT